MPAAAAAVDDRPLPVFPHPYAHRIHDAAAAGLPVSGFVIDMQARQAIGTVVAVVAAGAGRNDLTAADLTGKNLVACVRFVVACFKLLSFICPIHGRFLLKVSSFLLGGVAEISLRKPPGSAQSPVYRFASNSSSPFLIFRFDSRPVSGRFVYHNTAPP